jgi:parallel beta-helix repeat protein
MRLNILPALLLCLSTTWAASYHIATNGDDSRTAAQAGSAATPWKTLGRLSTVTLVPGDTILLRKGDVWRESLVLKQSGSTTQPIVVAPYGDATSKPQLTGTIPLVGTSISGRYHSRVPAGQKVTAVFAGQDKIRCARYPDTGWAIAASVDGDTALVAPGLGGQDWVGASIHLRTSMWTLETHRVKAQSGGRLVLDKKAIYGPPDSVRFFLSNHVSALQTVPAWAYSATDSTLRWTGSNPTIEASVLPTLIDLTNRSHVRIQGLRLYGSTTQAVKLGGTGIVVEDCELFEPGLVGIQLAGREGTFRNNRIEGAGNGALVGGGALHRIESNRIRRTALLTDFGPDGMGSGCCGGRAIDFSGDSNTVSRNVLDSTGYIGIGFRGLSTLVEENDIAHSCMTTDDCGGIYTYLGNYLDPGSTGSVIRRNFVRDPVGAPSGWPEPWDASIGIYLDDGSHDIRVDSNVVWGNATGIFLHNTRRAVVRGNVAFGNRNAQIAMSHDNLAGAGDMFDNRIEGNLLVALPGQGVDVKADIHQTQTLPLGSTTDNTLCSDQILSARCAKESTVIWQKSNLENADPRLGPQTQANGSFDSSRLGWSSWPSQAKLSLDSGDACLGGHCLKISYTGDTANNSPLANCSRTVATSQGQAWRLSFRAKALNQGQKLSPTFRRSNGDYATLGFSASVRLDTAWTSHSFLFRASVTESKARVDFHNSRTDSVYWLDDVSLRSVPDSVIAGLSTARLVTNASALPSSVPLAGSPWMDAWGKVQTENVFLESWQAKVVFPYPGWATFVRDMPVKRSLQVQRFGNRWEIDGLVGSARIVDVRGRTLAMLDPDAAGHATWSNDSWRGMCWLHAHGLTRTLLQPR